jgi:hypothetical protein
MYLIFFWIYLRLLDLWGGEQRCSPELSPMPAR